MLKPGQLATERIEELEYEIERLCAEVRNLHEMIGEIERQHAVTIAVALQERYGMRCPSEIEESALATIADLTEALSECALIFDRMAVLHPTRDLREVLPDPGAMAALIRAASDRAGGKQ